jgi:hypothetical protein
MHLSKDGQTVERDRDTCMKLCNRNKKIERTQRHKEKDEEGQKHRKTAGHFGSDFSPNLQKATGGLHN